MRTTTTWALVWAAATGLMFLTVVRAEINEPVREGATVLMEYSITVPESKVVIPKHVSQFVSGHHDVLPNLEKALTGMKQGEAKRIDLSADEAFGQYDEAKKVVIPTDHLPSSVTPGTVLTTEEGLPFVVLEVSGTEAQVDFNHPLAGKHVTIDVRILEVQPPATSTTS